MYRSSNDDSGIRRDRNRSAPTLPSGSPRGQTSFSLVEVILGEMLAFVVIIGIAAVLLYGEQGTMWRDGVRVLATVDELPSGKVTCRRCPLVFMFDGERHRVEETLAHDSEPGYVFGEAVALSVDPEDPTHAIAVDAIEETIAIGGLFIVVASIFAVWWPIRSFRSRVRG